MLMQRLASGSPVISYAPYVCLSCQLAAACAPLSSRRGYHASTPKSISRTRDLRYSTRKTTESSSKDASSIPPPSEANPKASAKEVSDREPVADTGHETATPARRARGAKRLKSKVLRPLDDPEEWESMRKRVILSASKTLAERRKRAKKNAGDEKPRKPRAAGKKLVRRIEGESKQVEGEASLSSALSKAALKELSKAGIDITKLEGHQTLQEALGLNTRDLKFSRVKTGDVALTALDIERGPVPRLSYGLSRALFNPGVIELRDLHSRVFNFDPYLEKILPVAEFDFSTIKNFTTASKDPQLAKVAQRFGKKYIGSSSSMTGLLKHFHYLLSGWREPDFKMMSSKFPLLPIPSFTRIQRGPDAVFLRWKNGHYAVDADKQYDDGNILSLMGQYMEKLLTVDKDVFERHRVGHSHALSEDERSTVDSYHYSTVGDFVMRSQLDAYDPRLPGTGMFDLKTRAVLPIRMSSKEYEWGTGYELQQKHGEYHSYEREYHDMIRATMLKYSLQVRMGRMDGIFVAYHNIARIFGFEYISLANMDTTLHGQSDPCLGDQEFAFSLHMLNDLLNRSIEKFPEQSLRLHIEARTGKVPFMYFFAEPVTEEEINAIQNRNKDKIAQWQRRILRLDPQQEEAEGQNVAPSTDIVPEAKENDPSMDATTRENSTYTDTDLADKTDAELVDALLDTPIAPEEKEPEKESSEPKPVFGTRITVHSYVQGQQVARPTDLKPSDEWEVRYNIVEMEKRSKAWSMYRDCMTRRKHLFSRLGKEEGSTAFWDMFLKKLKAKAEDSRRWRAELDAKDEGKPIVMWNDENVNQADITPGKPRRGTSASASTATSNPQPPNESIASRIFKTLKKWTGGEQSKVDVKNVAQAEMATSVTNKHNTSLPPRPQVESSERKISTTPIETIFEQIRSPVPDTKSDKQEAAPQYASIAELLRALRKCEPDTNKAIASAPSTSGGEATTPGNPRLILLNNLKTKIRGVELHLTHVRKDLDELKGKGSIVGSPSSGVETQTATDVDDEFTSLTTTDDNAQAATESEPEKVEYRQIRLRRISANRQQAARLAKIMYLHGKITAKPPAADPMSATKAYESMQAYLSMVGTESGFIKQEWKAVEKELVVLKEGRGDGVRLEMKEI